jgi:hypothetical protein
VTIVHNLIVGCSYSGKSNLAKRFAANAELNGEGVLVFDPLKSTGWPSSAKLYHTPDAFLNAVESATKAHVFIDEAKTLWDFDTKRADRILYQLRHKGLLVYVIGQRAEGMIPPNARNQCSKIFAFRQAKKDSFTLAEEYGEGLRHCLNVPKNTFVYSDGFSSGRAELDYSHGLPPFIREL